MGKKAKDLSNIQKKLSSSKYRCSTDLRRSLGRKSVGDIGNIDFASSEQASFSSYTSNDSDSCHINAHSGVFDPAIAENPDWFKNLPQDIQVSEKSILQAHRNERDEKLPNESDISMLDISLDKRKIPGIFECSVVVSKESMDCIINRHSVKEDSRASRPLNGDLSVEMPQRKPNTLRTVPIKRSRESFEARLRKALDESEHSDESIKGTNSPQIQIRNTGYTLSKELSDELPKRKPNSLRRVLREKNRKSLDTELRKALEDSDNTKVAPEQLDGSINTSCDLPLGAESCNINGLMDTNGTEMMKHPLGGVRVTNGSEFTVLAEPSSEKAVKLIIKTDKRFLNLNSNSSREDHKRKSLQNFVPSKNSPLNLSKSSSSGIPSPINANISSTHPSQAQNFVPLSTRESLATKEIRKSFQEKLVDNSLNCTPHESHYLHGDESCHSSASTLSLPSDITGFGSLTTMPSNMVRKSKNSSETSLSSNSLPRTNVVEAQQDGNNTWTENPFPDRTFDSQDQECRSVTGEDITVSVDEGSEEEDANEGEGSDLLVNPNMSPTQIQSSDISALSAKSVADTLSLCAPSPASTRQFHKIHEGNDSGLKHPNSGPENVRDVQTNFEKPKKKNTFLKAPSKKFTEIEMEKMRSGLKQWMDQIRKDVQSTVEESRTSSTAKASTLERPISTAPKTVKRKVPDPYFGNYRPPKRIKPCPYVTDRMYKFLEKKLKDKFGLESRIKAEDFVVCLCNIVQNTIKQKNRKKYHTLVFKLRDKMVKLGLIKNQFEYHLFIEDYLPMAFRVKAIPCYGCPKGPSLDVKDLHIDL